MPPINAAINPSHALRLITPHLFAEMVGFFTP
jgi:hypothetical protein